MNSKYLCIKPVHDECYMKDKCEKFSVCPIVLMQNLLSGKWTILILWYLIPNTLRFGDIKRRLPQLTQRMLTLQLRSLEEDKLITRKVYPEVPPRVEYSLTEAGKEFIPLLEMMHSLGSRYLNAGLLNEEYINENESN